MIGPYWHLIAVLCVWRITHLLHAEDGPWNLSAGLRKRMGAGFWASLLGGFYCLSVWIAVPFACLVGGTLPERLLLCPALSAGAILLERATREPAECPPPYFEVKESGDGVLRS